MPENEIGVPGNPPEPSTPDLLSKAAIGKPSLPNWN